MAVFFAGMIPVLRINGAMELTKDDLRYFTNWGYYSATFYYWAQTVYGLWFMYNTRQEASENKDELRTSQRTADTEFYFSGPCAFWKFICFALMWSQTIEITITLVYWAALLDPEHGSMINLVNHLSPLLFLTIDWFFGCTKFNIRLWPIIFFFGAIVYPTFNLLWVKYLRDGEPIYEGVMNWKTTKDYFMGYGVGMFGVVVFFGNCGLDMLKWRVIAWFNKKKNAVAVEYHETKRRE